MFSAIYSDIMSRKWKNRQRGGDGYGAAFLLQYALYSLAEIPQYFLKVPAKLLELVKPTLSLISLMVRVVLARYSLAWEILNLFRYSTKFTPKAFLK